MSASTIIVEVRQRVPGDITISRELGYFVDAGMARQTIDWLYREIYKRVMARDYIPDLYLPSSILDEINLKGYNHWMVDDLNKEFPIFYTVEHRLYSNVPIAGDGQFTLTVSQEPFDTGVPLLP